MCREGFVTVIDVIRRTRIRRVIRNFFRDKRVGTSWTWEEDAEYRAKLREAARYP